MANTSNFGKYTITRSKELNVILNALTKTYKLASDTQNLFNVNLNKGTAGSGKFASGLDNLLKLVIKNKVAFKDFGPTLFKALDGKGANTKPILNFFKLSGDAIDGLTKKIQKYEAEAKQADTIIAAFGRHQLETMKDNEKYTSLSPPPTPKLKLEAPPPPPKILRSEDVIPSIGPGMGKEVPTIASKAHAVFPSPLVPYKPKPKKPETSIVTQIQKDLAFAESMKKTEPPTKPATLKEKIGYKSTLENKTDDDDYTSYGRIDKGDIPIEDLHAEIFSYGEMAAAAISESLELVVDAIVKNAEDIEKAVEGEKAEIPQANIAKGRVKAGLKGVGMGTGITPFVTDKISKAKDYAAEKGITGGGKAQALGAVAGIGLKGAAKGLAGFGKKSVAKTFQVMGKMGGALKGGAAAGASALLGVMRSMAPFKGLGDALTSSFGALGSIMAAQFAPVIADLVTNILTPDNIKIFTDLGKALVPIVSAMVDLLGTIMQSEEFSNLMSAINDAIGSLFELFENPEVKTAIESVAKNLIKIATLFFEILADILPSLTPLFTEIGVLFDELFGIFNDPEVKSAIKLVVDNLIDMAVNFIKTLSTLLPVIIPLLIPVITFLTDIGVFVSNVVLNLATMLSNNKDVIFGIFNSIITFVNSVLGGINKVLNVLGIDSIPLMDQVSTTINNTTDTSYDESEIGESFGGGHAPSMSTQGSILATGIAKVHAGEMVVKDRVIREAMREAMIVNNNFYGQVGANERREFSRTMKELW